MAQQQSISDILDRFANASDEDQTSIAQILRALGDRSFAANLLIAAAAVVSPLSGIPLFSSFCGIAIVIISAQMLMDRDHLWLPDFLMSKKVDTSRLRKASQRIRKPASWMDGVAHVRLACLVRHPSLFCSQVICMLCGLAMPFLEVLPFTSSIMGAIVCMFAFGMLARDGLFTIFGYLGAAVLPVSAFLMLH
ncbi:exopolysaccharide biosynthesis protein [Paracoccus sp. Z330]|uniref:Exopolysaccharide biosynthesis protein n=1 Tax=Paracoccus onchidii TaxID=3017813 RepID=A0ABT4ZHW3_9RHOB|nr:exopolysaccharide biosynthesis protein [Paracoccus onchidii]MDB6178944.1 exopolysaccharide biosynthesis protein [Paracoccus onchidii]